MIRVAGQEADRKGGLLIQISEALPCGRATTP